MSATAAPSSSPSSPPSSSGGAGGKLLRTRRFARRRITPYDRPDNSRRHGSSSSLLRKIPFVGEGMESTTDIASRLVGSASRVLTSSASYLFSSFFKRNLPLAISNGDTVVGQILLEGSPSTRAEENDADSFKGLPIEENAVKKGKKEDELTEIEQIIKDKKLSREEFSRLTKILRSRVVDNQPSVGLSPPKDPTSFQEEDSMDDRTQLDTPQLETQRWREERRKAWEEKENPFVDSGTYNEVLLPYFKNSSGLSSSPVEVARAFMGDRSSKFTRAAVPIYGRLLEEDLPIKRLDLSQQTEGSSQDRNNTLLAKRTWRRVPGPLATPYSRFQLHSVQPRVALQHIQTASTSGREIRKRRTPMLDERSDTVGPIRRTRLKTLSAEASNNFGTAATGPNFVLSRRNLLFSDASLSGQNIEGKHVSDSRKDNHLPGMDEKKKAATPSLMSVPVQSSEMARKILETLEKMTPSPKGKVLDEELALVRERIPKELTHSMLNEHARKSMLPIDFPKSCEPSIPSSKAIVECLPGATTSNAARKTEDIKAKGVEPARSPFSSLSSTAPVFASVSEHSPKVEGSLSTLERESKLTEFIAQQSTKNSESILKIGASDGIVSAADKKKGFRISAVFEESNSDDEAQTRLKGSTKLESAKPTVVSTATDTVAGEKQITSDHGGKNGALSPELTMKATVSSFTFPLNSPPGAVFDPPTPKPMFSSTFSTTTGNTSSSSLDTLSSYRGSQIAAKGTVPSNGNMKHEEAAMVPPFLYKRESKLETEVSTAGAATSSSLQFSHSKQVLTDVEPKSTGAFQSAPVQVGHPFDSHIVSTTSSIGTSSPLPEASTGATSMPSSVGSLPSLFSEVSPPSTTLSGWTSLSTGYNTTNIFSSSQFSGASSPALSSPVSGFGHPNIQFQFGSVGQNKSVPSISEVEGGKPHKRSHTGANKDASKSSVEGSVTTTAPANGGPAGSVEVAASSTTVATVPIKPAPTSLSLGGANVLQERTVFAESSASTAVSSTTSNFFGCLSGANPQFSLSASSNTNTTLASVSGWSTSVTAGLPGLPTGTSTASLGLSSSLFGMGNSAPFGSATLPVAGTPSLPSFGMTSTGTNASTGAGFGTAGLPAFGTSATAPAFGSAATMAFGSSGSLFGSAKPFGSLAGDSASKTTSSGAPFASGFGTTSAAFGSSPLSSSGFNFGGGLASTPPGNPFSSSSSLSSSPFNFTAKAAPAVGQPPSFVSGSFGSSAPIAASGDTSQNDQMNMEDSMAEEPPETSGNMTPAASPLISSSGPALGGFLFNTQSTTTTSQSPFNFGFPPSFNTPGQTSFTFSAQAAPGPVITPGAPAQQNAFGQTANLDYGGGVFAPGTAGGERSGRRFIKARRTGGKKGK